MLNSFKIARACEDHIDDIMVVENLSFEIPWSRQSITDEFLHNDNAVYFCAVADGKAVGYAGMWLVLDEGHITNIAVHPDFRRCGIGGSLMRALLEEAEKRGLAALTLEVRRSNDSARYLQAKYRFEDGGVKRYYADNNEDAIMWKRLK